MGFVSGLPLALTGATLQLRQAEAGISLRTLGFFSLVQVAYNFKPLWAPFLDTVNLPWLTRALGRRRSWLAMLAALLAAAILAMGATEPAQTVRMAGLAVLVAFLSATQDIAIDAYRIEILPPERQGAGASATQLGYRLGMLTSGAGALYAAAGLGWKGAYATMAALMALGVMVALAAPEPTRMPQPGRARPRRPALDPRRRLRALANAFRPLLPEHGRLGYILLFVVIYRLGSALAERMAIPLYNQLGFTKIEIADLSKLMGVAAAMLGIGLGGVLIGRIGILRALFVTGALQTAALGFYILLARSGHDLAVLGLTIAADNIAGGMNSAAIVAFLSALCGRTYTATQYALLSALTLIGRNFFGSFSGVLAEALGWTGFFSLCIALALPGLILLLWFLRYPSRAGLRGDAASPGALAHVTAPSSGT